MFLQTATVSSLSKTKSTCSMLLTGLL